jgi:sec-independent protein translocase protein TatA
MGKGMRTLKNATNDIKGEIKRSVDNQGIDTNLTSEVSEEINKVKDKMADLAGSIRREL